MATKSTAKKRKCNSCGKMTLESKGVKILRGISFMCKSCYNKNKKKEKKNKSGETCEFC